MCVCGSLLVFLLCFKFGLGLLLFCFVLCFFKGEKLTQEIQAAAPERGFYPVGKHSASILFLFVGSTPSRWEARGTGA